MRLFVIISLLAISLSVSAQPLPQSSINKLKRSEDSLKLFGQKMINERLAVQRFLADSSFTKVLVRALKTPNSFYYPFDSLQTISHLYAPDSSFRIFSWEFTRDENFYWQRGAIQIRTNDGSLKLYPLFDMSNFTMAPEDSVRTAYNWIGSIYYKIVLKTFNDKKYYTLLGYDDNNVRSTKKWIEVLTFNDQGKPVFGGPFFSIPDGGLKPKGSGARFVLEYKKDALAKLNYDKDLDMIVYDHLVSADNKSEKAYDMVPDGDYEGFKWANGRWIHVEKVFTFKLQDGQAPVPLPLKDAEGKNDEMRLMQQSQKNRQGMKQNTPPPPVIKKPQQRKADQNKQQKDREESY